MAKRLLKNSFIGLLSILFLACHQKTIILPTLTVPQVTINGDNYGFVNQVNVSKTSGIFHLPNPNVNGGYISYTSKFMSNSILYHTYVLGQETTFSDTISIELAFISTDSIAVGTYNIYASKYTPNATSYPFVKEFSTYGNSFNDSIAVGTLNITELHYGYETISGTYTYTATGTKGSFPATLVVSGQFNKIGFQEF
jgi:hypothetical protein